MKRLRGMKNAAVVQCGMQTETLVAYAAEGLCSGEIVPVEEHLKTCLYCQEQLRALAEVDHLVRSRAQRVSAIEDSTRMDRVLAEAEALYRHRNDSAVPAPANLTQQIL